MKGKKGKFIKNQKSKIFDYVIKKCSIMHIWVEQIAFNSIEKIENKAKKLL